MLVSAISQNSSNGYILSNSSKQYRAKSKDIIGDTAFNSLTPYSSKKAVPAEDMPKVFDSINQWKNFCHKQILGEKLNVIA